MTQLMTSYGMCAQFTFFLNIICCTRLRDHLEMSPFKYQVVKITYFFLSGMLCKTSWKISDRFFSSLIDVLILLNKKRVFFLQLFVGTFVTDLWKYKLLYRCLMAMRVHCKCHITSQKVVSLQIRKHWTDL